MADELGQAFIEIRANFEALTADLSAARAEMTTATAALQSQVDRMSQSMTQSMRGVQQSTEQMTNRFQSGGQRVSESTREMSNALRAADQQFNQAFQELGQNMAQFGNDTNGLISRIRTLGAEQKKTADQMIADNSRLRGEILQSIGAVLARSNSMDKVSENIKRNGEAIHALSGPFMRVGSALENMAKQGNVALVALRELGPTASTKALQDQIKLLNQGLMRFQAVAMLSAIAAAGMVVALVKLSNELDGRLIPAADQFKATWLNALEPLATAVTEFFLVIVEAGTAVGEFMSRIRETSPILAGMITGFVALAPAVALVLSPLAIAAKAAGSYSLAIGQLITQFKPLITGFLTIAGPVILVTGLIVTLIGFFTKLTKESEVFRAAVTSAWNQVKAAAQAAFAPIAPLIEQMKTAFINMVAAITGAAPNVTSVWDSIGAAVGKFVTFFANVAMPLIKTAFQAASIVIQAAIKILIAAFNGITAFWNQHGPAIKAVVTEVFQAVSAVINGAVNIIKQAFNLLMQAIQPLMPLIKLLGTTIFNVISQIVGDFLKGSEGMSGFGDKVQAVVDFISNNILPILQTAFQNASMIISEVITFLITAFQKISAFWDTHGPTIIAMVQKVGSFLMSMFQDAADFIGVIAPQIANIVKSAFELIKQVVEIVMPIILGIIKTVFPAIMAIIKAVMPIIKFIIIDTWEAIKRGIQGAVKVIQGIIGAFSALLKGDWSALWENIKLILSGAWDLIVSIFNLVLVGKILKIFKLFGKTTGDLFNKLWDAVKKKTTDVWNSIKGFVSGIWNSIKSTADNIWNGIKSRLSGVWNSLNSTARSIFNGLKNAVISVWNSLKNTVINGANNIKSRVQSAFRSLAGSMRGIWNGLVSGIKGALNVGIRALNRFISGVNSAIRKLNKAPGVNLPTVPSIPLLARGGNILSGGLAIIGEAGPELLNLPRGARVSPLGGGGDMEELGKTMQLVQHIQAQATPEQLQRFTERALRKIAAQSGLIF